MRMVSKQGRPFSQIATPNQGEKERVPFRTGLFVHNSLTRRREEFIPANGKIVNWYICGPTVYDESHMGHARNYVAFDIIRRIMEAYFQYDVRMVMNVTDIDDKIIMRAKEQGKEPSEIARYWERSFFADMDALGLKPTECIVRVSEHIPEILEYIDKIMQKGYGYVSNGSVYFDIGAFQSKGKHVYAKLDPGSIKDLAKYKESEGALGLELQSEKRNPFDFALWKKSKPNEPKWGSPWGEGRPGWHIECSAMASNFFKVFPLDLHSGGVDLKFPHHDNEMAQAEAYYECHNWVNYFLHSGHLEIKGLKMSKSLKNFVTIKDVLKKFSGRQVRMMILMHKWDATFNYSDEAMPEAVKKDRQFYEFILNAKTTVRNANFESEQKWNKAEFELYSKLSKQKEYIHVALCDNFDTPTVIKLLSDLVSATNIYLGKEKNSKAHLILSIAEYVKFILESMGVCMDISIFTTSGKSDANEETVILPYMNAISRFRDNVKENAGEGPKKILEICDTLRDKVLPELGIKLEDTGKNRPAVWKFYGKEKLQAVVLQKQEAVIKKQEEKAEENLRKSIPPEKYFREMKSKYSAFDDNGVPTHDFANKPLSPEAIRRLRKEYRRQATLHKAWLAEQKK